MLLMFLGKQRIRYALILIALYSHSVMVMSTEPVYVPAAVVKGTAVQPTGRVSPVLGNGGMPYSARTILACFDFRIRPAFFARAETLGVNCGLLVSSSAVKFPCPVVAPEYLSFGE
jgi:hypothetical protein